MKKVIRSAALICLVLVMSLTMLPSVSAASSTTQNKAAVYSFLRNTLGFNHAAACGIMANVEKESNFNPTSVARDSNGKLSGGLFQWNGSRFTNLINYCSKYGYNYLSIKGQMQFLKSELNSSSGYKKILSYMKSVSNSASGAYNAGYYWCYNFERPANKSSRSAQRGNLAKSYFNNYKSSGSTTETTTQAVTLSAPKVSISSKFDVMSTLSLSWTSGGSYCTSYIVQIARKDSGAYSWSTASSFYATSRSFSTASNNLGTGSYAVKVIARASNGTQKTGAIAYFTIGCSYHAYNTKVSKAATATATGTRVYTCQYCGHKVTQTIASGKSSVKSLSTPKASVSLNTSTAVATIKCSGSTNADGYIISVGTYVLAYVPASSGTCKIPDMYDGTKLKITAFKTVGTKTIKSSAKTVTV